MVVNAENPAKFIDPATGEPTDATELPAMKDGKQVGTYTIDPATGKVTFTPNKDFVELQMQSLFKQKMQTELQRQQLTRQQLPSNSNW